MLKTIKSNPEQPIRVMIYGQEGVGKSTLGAKSDKPLFISLETGVNHLKDKKNQPVDVIEGIQDWNSLLSSLDDVLNDKHNFKTLILDSADWIEKLAHAEIMSESDDKNIVTAVGGYGAGYRQSETMHRELIERLTKIYDQKKMNIIVTAHAHVKTKKDPSFEHDYDSYEIKCHELVSSLWREWIDNLLFARFATFLKTDKNPKNKKAKAFSDGSRIVYTTKQPYHQAKNRYDMPEEMEFDLNFWDTLVDYSKKGLQDEKIEDVLKDINQMLTKVDESTRATVTENVEKNKDNLKKLITFRKRLTELTKGDNDNA